MVKKMDMVIIGFALFTMYFGAGNLVFPPYLGMGAGDNWFLAFLIYFLADIGLAILTIYAILKNNCSTENITGKMGNIQGKVIMSIIILSITFIAAPRTGAITYEMAILPIVGESKLAGVITSIMFFGIVLAMSIKESKVVDTLGKYLTPALIIGLLVIIVGGVLFPLGVAQGENKFDNLVVESVGAGYQTLDSIVSLIFGMIIVKTAEQKGYINIKDKFKVLSGASLVAGVCLFVIYGGLTYVGATTSNLFDIGVDHSELFVSITNGILGRFSLVFLFILIPLACSTTAAALLSAGANYFSNLSGGKYSYKAILITLCVLSGVLSNVGLSQIISIAAPILNLIYPGALTLVILSFFSDKIKNLNVYKFATYTAMLISLIEILEDYEVVGFSIIEKLPLDMIGFPWIIPAIIAGVIGGFVKSGVKA